MGEMDHGTMIWMYELDLYETHLALLK